MPELGGAYPKDDDSRQDEMRRAALMQASAVVAKSKQRSASNALQSVGSGARRRRALNVLLKASVGRVRALTRAGAMRASGEPLELEVGQRGRALRMTVCSTVV